MNSQKFDLILKRWGKRSKPVRKLILWGWDEKNSPSFLLLFGFHEFKNGQVEITNSDIEEFNEEIILTGMGEYEYEISPGKYNVLDDTVEYFGYVLLRGNQNHFPNHKNLSIKIDSSDPYIIELKWTYSGGKYHARRYGNLENCSPLKVPFFARLSYERIVELIKKQGFRPRNLKIATSPNDILKLEEESLDFLDLVVNIFSNENLYMRKKYLRELISLNPTKDIFEKILELGSPEVISGLLLELARNGNPTLKSQVKNLISNPIHLSDKKYREGIKRWARIYLNAIDSKVKDIRITEIRNHIKNMELIPIYAKKPRKPRSIKKKESRMSINDYVNTWSGTKWKYFGPTLKFRLNKFTNGTSLNHIFFKNILQEAYIYNLPDILGKVAHFIDTPKFHYLMNNSGWFGTRIYFERYIRRIIDEYAHSNEKNYIETMKYFFSSYIPTDIVGGYKFNYLLNYFLEPPRSTITGRSRYNSYSHLVPRINSKDFKVYRQRQTFNLKNTIWDRNIDKVIEILSLSTVNKIQNYFFRIVKDSPDLEEILNNLSTRSLVKLSLLENHRISSFFREKLIERVNQSEKFDSEIMFALMESSDTELHSEAWDYLERVKGIFNPKTIVKMIWLENIDFWFDLFEEKVNNLNGVQYYDFISSLIIEGFEDLRKQTHLSEEIVEILMKSTLKINEILKEKKGEIIEISIDFLSAESKFPDWLVKFIQNLICSIKLKDLISITKSLKLDLKKELKGQYVRDLVSILVAIKENEIPDDRVLLDIIDFGTPRMVDLLVNIIDNRKKTLIERQATLLLLFESDMIALNELAAEAFEMIPVKKRNNILSVLIDSPIQKAYLFALKKLDDLFKEKIPKDLIIQMLEHGAHQVKAYISNKISFIINELSNGNGNAELFMYYFKTLVLLPNLYSKSKDKLYEIIPQFVKNNCKYKEEIQKFLLKLGSSNIIKDSERSLVALAKIKQEGESFAT